MGRKANAANRKGKGKPMNLIQLIYDGIEKRILPNGKSKSQILREKQEAERKRENSVFTDKLNAGAWDGRRAERRREARRMARAKLRETRKPVGAARVTALLNRPNPRRLGLHK